MANHSSSLKRIRSNGSKRLRNRYQSKTVRNSLKDFFALTNKNDAAKQMPVLSSMLDRLAKKNIIHKNKASNLKSEMAVHVNHIQ